MVKTMSNIPFQSRFVAASRRDFSRIYRGVPDITVHNPPFFAGSRHLYRC